LERPIVEIVQDRIPVVSKKGVGMDEVGIAFTHGDARLQ
jgi:hypothetical protein